MTIFMEHPVFNCFIAPVFHITLEKKEKRIQRVMFSSEDGKNSVADKEKKSQLIDSILLKTSSAFSGQFSQSAGFFAL